MAKIVISGMSYSILDILVCGYCHSAFTHEESALACNNCQTFFPFKDHLFFHTEVRNDLADSIAFHKSLEENTRNYHQFIRLKAQRPAIDAYAAFQPFNESTRAIYPFIELIKSNLKPGDWILDTWCRTAWTSNWLSGLFPEQNILSIWEGDRDILGYQGFNFWFDKSRVSRNQYFLFADLNKKLPIKSKSFAFINGLETLHRYKQSNVVHEFQRILNDEGILLHPHNHLSNAEPVPYFDRGERQLHGQVYNRYFKALLKDKPKRHFIMSEIELFEWDKTAPIVNNPDMTDYNALIGIVPEKLAGEKIKAYKTNFEHPDNLYVLINPLLLVDYSESKIAIMRDHLNGAVGRMLFRHPVYEKRISEAANFVLQEHELKFLYWSKQLLTLTEITDQLAISIAEVIEIAKKLEKLDIIQVHQVSYNAIKLYYFQSNQIYWPEESFCTIEQLWKEAAYMYAGNPMLILEQDQSTTLTWDDCNELVISIQRRLQAEGLKKGDIITIFADIHFEAILLFWAATMTGLTVQILNSNNSTDTAKELIRQAQPKMAFCTHQNISVVSDLKKIVFDLDVEPTEITSFSDWLAEADDETPLMPIQLKSTDGAAILYTSGSTGTPNAIELTHSQLYFSAKKIVDVFQWQPGERYLVTAEIDAMSGLRNTCLSTLYAGCCIVIPEYGDENKIFKILKAIKEYQINIISSTPALLKQFVKLGSVVSADISSLNKVMSTAAILTQQLAQEFFDLFNLKILNYYGLTETSGICLANGPDTQVSNLHALGIPAAGMVQLVDDYGNIVEGEGAGEIRVYGANVIKNYKFVSPGGFRFKNGWIYTGDVAFRDENGLYHFKDRKRNIFKNVNGQTIYLNEVSTLLATCPAIEDVQLLSTIENDLERLVAICVPKFKKISKNEVLNEVRQYLKQNLDAYSHPDYIYIVENIPYNNRGKVSLETIKKIVA